MERDRISSTAKCWSFGIRSSQGGKALMMNANASRALMELMPITKRSIKVRFNLKHKKADSDINICANQRCNE